MTMRILTFLCLVTSVSAQTWDVSDYYGVPTVKAPVELPYTGGPISHASWKITGPLGEVAWQQLSNGNIQISQPARSASHLAIGYQAGGGSTIIGGGSCPAGSFYAASYTFYVPPVGELLAPRPVTPGPVSANLIAGNTYFVVSNGTTNCPSSPPAGFAVSATYGGTPIVLTDRGAQGNQMSEWVVQGSAWDGGTGIISHGVFASGDPFTLRCAETCTAPTGLDTTTVRYLKPTSTDHYDVYADRALTTKVNVTGPGTGVNEVISSYQYTLTNSASSQVAPANPVVVTSNGAYTDITNGLTGFRIANPCNPNWASIQGINTPNGWVAARAPNLLYTATGTNFPQTIPVSGLSCTLNWIERGPLKVEVQITYTRGTAGLDGQPGVYIADHILYADSKSVIPRIETNLNMSEYLNISSTFDTIRWRGMDVTVANDTVAPFTSGNYFRLAGWSLFDRTSGSVGPWIDQPLKYGQFYQAAGGTGTNLIGVWGGFGEEQIQGGFGSAGFYVSYLSPVDSTAGTWINLGMYPLNGLCTRTRRRIGIYSSTKADLPASTSTMTEMALFNFQFSLAPSISKLLSAQYAPAADPPGGWPYPFMGPAEGAALVASMRTDPTAFTNLFSKLYSNSTDPNGLDDINGWRANDSTGAHAMTWAGMQILPDLLTGMYSVGGNSADQRAFYEMLYNPMLSLGGLVAALQDSNSSPYTKANAQRAMGFYCGLAWDPNWAPLDQPHTGENFGLANQETQAFLERQIFSTYCTNQPYLKSRYLKAESDTRNITLPIWLNPFGDNSGVVRDSSHYVSASIEQFKNSYAAMASRGVTFRAGETNLFANQVNQEFGYMTPPDPRFANNRAEVCFGDASYDRQERFGSAAKTTGNQGAKYAWVNFAASQEQSFFSNAIFSFDNANAITPVQQPLSAIILPSHGAALRFNYGTSNESYLFHIFGPANDHMFPSEDNSFIFYALNAPVSTMFASQGGPQISDRRLLNNLTMDTEADWTVPVTGNPSFMGTLLDRFSSSDPTTVNFFSGSRVQWTESQQVRTGGPTWNRRIRFFNFDPTHPIVIIDDSFTGTNATAYKIFHYNQHAAGPVSNAPGGTYTPIASDFTVDTSNTPSTLDAYLAGNSLTNWMASPTTHFPSGGTAANMTTSAISRFSFSGATWPASPSGVLNWDFYSIPNGSSPQFLIGAWCSQLKGDYAPVYGPNPKECQEILKVRSNGTQQEAFWLPYAKTGTPNGVPTAQACGTQVVFSGQTTCWDLPHVQWTDGTNNVLATFDSTSETFGGLTISGGLAECDWNATTGTCYVSGSVAGTRTITLPAGFTVTSGAVGRSGANYTFYHPGGAVPPTYSFTIATTPVSRRTSSFSFTPPAGTAAVHVKAGSLYAVSVACLSACSVSVELPIAPQSVSWEFVDGSGNVLFSSNPVTI